MWGNLLDARQAVMGQPACLMDRQDGYAGHETGDEGCNSRATLLAVSKYGFYM